MFLGIANFSKAYKLYKPTMHKIIISMDVIFSEEEFWQWDGVEAKKHTLIIFYDEK